MKINIIAIGKKLPEWISNGIHYYEKQLPKHLNFKIIQLEPQYRKKQNISRVKEIESEMLLKEAENSNILIAMDEHGQQKSTIDFKNSLDQWTQNGDSVSIIIGGADGLSSKCLESSDEKWALSRLTLPHSMARLLITEQLFRAYTLTINHPYHRN